MIAWKSPSQAAEATDKSKPDQRQGSLPSDIDRWEPWLAWPFDGGTHAKFLQTYGQSERVSPLDVHEGLDLAVPAGTRVYSPVDGRVAMLFINNTRRPHRGIVISTVHGDVEVMVKLMHLRKNTIQVNLGDRVSVGDYLGNVVQWPTDDPDDLYPSHLHLGLGIGHLDAKGKRKSVGGEDELVLNPVDAYEANANPLVHLRAPIDEIPPVCVSLNPGGRPVEASFREHSTRMPDNPLVFRPLIGTPSEWKQSADILDPLRLSGTVDIAFALRDLHTFGVDYALAPLTVRLTIHRSGESSEEELVLERKLLMDGPLYASDEFAKRIYLEPKGSMAKDHSAFVFHLTSLNGRGAEDDPPRGWVTEPGDYVVRVFAGDLTFPDTLVAAQRVTALSD